MPYVCINTAYLYTCYRLKVCFSNTDECATIITRNICKLQYDTKKPKIERKQNENYKALNITHE